MSVTFTSTEVSINMMAGFRARNTVKYVAEDLKIEERGCAECNMYTSGTKPIPIFQPNGYQYNL